MERKLADFTKGDFQIGRPKIVFGIWYFIVEPIFRSRFTPNIFRVRLLRLFGSQVGSRVLIKSDVQVHFPWNLSIGNNSWIGKGTTFINHAAIHIEDNVCISQDATICSGSHEYRTVSLNYKHREVRIMSGAWICTRAVVLPAAVVGKNSIVSAGEVAGGLIPDDSLVKNQTITKLEY